LFFLGLMFIFLFPLIFSEFLEILSNIFLFIFSDTNLLCGGGYFFLIFFLYYCAGWGYIVASTKVFIMYQLYHTWIHTLHCFPPSIHGTVSTGIIFVFICMCTYFLHCTHLLLPPFPATPLPLGMICVAPSFGNDQKIVVNHGLPFCVLDSLFVSKGPIFMFPSPYNNPLNQLLLSPFFK
jgi:hypothetical protein